ncbi:hypothetical protein STEG23_008277 [Scotinomys teguina]
MARQLRGRQKIQREEGEKQNGGDTASRCHEKQDVKILIHGLSNFRFMVTQAVSGMGSISWSLTPNANKINSVHDF